MSRTGRLLRFTSVPCGGSSPDLGFCPVRTVVIPCVERALVRTGLAENFCRAHQGAWCAPNQRRAHGDVSRHPIVPRHDVPPTPPHCSAAWQNRRLPAPHLPGGSGNDKIGSHLDKKPATEEAAGHTPLPGRSGNDKIGSHLDEKPATDAVAGHTPLPGRSGNDKIGSHLDKKPATVWSAHPQVRLRPHRHTPTYRSARIPVVRFPAERTFYLPKPLRHLFNSGKYCLIHSAYSSLVSGCGRCRLTSSMYRRQNFIISSIVQSCLNLPSL